MTKSEPLSTIDVLASDCAYYMHKNLSTYSDEDLMIEVSNGVKVAFDLLYQRYEKKMFYFFFRKLKNNQEKAEDFLHDLFIKLIEQPHSFNTDRKFAPWLYSVAHNMVKNEYKKMTVRQVMDHDADTTLVATQTMDPAHLTDNELFKIKMMDALNEINPESSTAFIMKYHDGYSIEEIATTLNIKEGTVKSKLFYAKKLLAEKLQMFHPKQ